MSSDITPDVPPRIRCEAIKSSSTSQNTKCHRSHGTVLRYPGPARHDPPADDPAFLIGLALGQVRQGDGLTGTVPDTVISRLQAQAGRKDKTAHTLLRRRYFPAFRSLCASSGTLSPSRLNRRRARSR